jgi:hypothetical protein
MDDQTGQIKLSKVMPEGMVFPFGFGYFPRTKVEDGDPLDVLVLSDGPTFPGSPLKPVDTEAINVQAIWEQATPRPIGHGEHTSYHPQHCTATKVSAAAVAAVQLLRTPSTPIPRRNSNTPH